MSRALPSVLIPYTGTDALHGHKRAEVAPRLTVEDCAILGLPIAGGGETRGAIVTRRPWGVLVTYAAIVSVRTVEGVRFYPRRVAQSRSMGTDPGLRVRVAGKRGRCFSSSQMFTLPDGSLHNCAVMRCTNSHPATSLPIA